MRYTITEKELPDALGNSRIVYVLNITGHNIFFGWDDSSDYDAFRIALNTKGIDNFVDLIIQDHNTAFLTFIES